MDGPDTPTIKNHLKELRGQVQNYSGRSQKSDKPFSIEPMLRSKRLYYILPLIILILLVFGKPSFLYVEDPDDPSEKKFSYSKLMLYWLLISGTIVLGLFGYNYKNEKADK